MPTINALSDAIRDAWASIPAPPADDLKYMTWGWGEEAWQAFVNVAPMDVDIDSAGFAAADPLLNLPPRAAAAYLGPYLLSLLIGLEGQKAVGIFHDITTRAHTLACLKYAPFWEEVIKPFLPSQCRDVLVRVVNLLASEHEALAQSPEDVNTLLRLANTLRGTADP